MKKTIIITLLALAAGIASADGLAQEIGPITSAQFGWTFQEAGTDEKPVAIRASLFAPIGSSHLGGHLGLRYLATDTDWPKKAVPEYGIGWWIENKPGQLLNVLLQAGTYGELGGAFVAAGPVFRIAGSFQLNATVLMDVSFDENHWPQDGSGKHGIGMSIFMGASLMH